jgi:hypothetical protein
MSAARSCGNNDKIIYDKQKLLDYLWSVKHSDSNHNILEVCRNNVNRPGLQHVFRHYFVTVDMSDNERFEYHPGSQPHTFRDYNENSRREYVHTEVLCNECFDKRMAQIIESDNAFNVLLNNCEHILCSHSKQASYFWVIIISLLMFIISLNIIFIIILIFAFVSLVMYNQFYKITPQVVCCEHKYKLV